MTVTFDADPVERPFRCLVEAFDGDRLWLEVRAIGPAGARVTAMQAATDKGFDPVAVLVIEEVAA